MQPGETLRGNRVEYSNPGLSARGWPLGWWLNLTAPPKPRGILDVAARERLRKAELTSYLILAVFGFLIMLVSNSFDDPATGTSVGIMAIGLIIAVIFNRVGLTRVAAYLVPVLLSALIALAVAGVVGLDVIALPAYDLFAVPIFLSSLIIGRRAPWIFALAAIAFIVLDFNFQSHALITAASPAYGRATNFDTIAYYTSIFNPWGMINRGVGLNLIAALIGWLGARSTDFAIARADRSEELAELERRELERTHELEEGVRQLLAVHVHLANGDFNVRAPAIRNSLLWQIGSSLNNLVARLGRLAEAEFVLRRTQEEANRVTEAIYMLNSGRQPIWPGASRTPLDRLVEVLRTSLTPRGAAGGGGILGGPQAPQLPPSATGAYPGAPGMAANQPPSMAPGMPMPGMPGGMMGAPDRVSPPTGYPGSAPVPNSMNAPNTPNGPNNPVPDWMRPLMPADGSGGAGQPQRPMVESPRSPISGPGSGPASGFGAPVGPGYGSGYGPPPPQAQPQAYPPQADAPDVNPWALEPGEQLDDSDLPEWLRQPNQE